MPQVPCVFSWYLAICPDNEVTGPVDWIDSPGVLLESVARIASVKELGLDVGIDFHGRLHKGMAKQLIKLLEPMGPLFIEGRSILSVYFTESH